MDESKVYNMVAGVLVGTPAVINDREMLNEVVSRLHNKDGHKGVIIGGCNPWSVRVMENFQ